MGILYVNGKRRGLRVRGRARVRLTGNPTRRRRARKGKMPPALARYWKAQRAGRKLAKRKSRKRGHAARGSTSMARRKGRKKRQPAGLKRYWAARRAAGKAGRPGKTRRTKAARRRAALKGLRRKGRKSVHRTKRRRKARHTTAPRKHRRRSRSATRRARGRQGAVTVRMLPGGTMATTRGMATIPMYARNPSRRRRRKRRGTHRTYGRARRRGHRRYRRNPGGIWPSAPCRSFSACTGRGSWSRASVP